MKLRPFVLPVVCAALAAPGAAWAQSAGLPSANQRQPSAAASFDSGASTGARAKFEPVDGKVYHGASVPKTWDEGGLRAELETYRKFAGKRVSVVTWFASLYDQGRQSSWKTNYLPNLQRVQRLGAMSLVKFSTQDPAFESNGKIAKMDAIARGVHDNYFAEFADTVKAFGGPVFISINHEMNGFWYPYSQTNSAPEAKTGMTPADFKAMWRRVAGIFRERGASNVAWVWSPNVPEVANGTTSSQYYPGDDVVDWIGPSFYSGNTIADLRPLYSAYATRKPFFITEWATSTEKNQYNRRFAGEAAWVRTFFKGIEDTYPRVKAISWFQWKKSDGDHLLQRVPEQATSYAEAIQKPRYVDLANAPAGTETPDRGKIALVGEEPVLNEVPRIEGGRAERPPVEAVKTERRARRRITLEAVRTETVRVER
jgi:hypothetical protein